MDTSNPFDTSFIPQRPTVRVDPAFRPRVEFNLAMIVALALLLGVLAASGGMYYWRITVEGRIATKEADLAAKADQINMPALKELERVEARLSTGRRLLQNHTAFSAFLDFLEEKSLFSVAVVKVNYSVDDGAPSADISYVAPDYAAVYLQERTLGAAPSVKDAKIHDMQIEPSSGYVGFDIKTMLTSDALKYVELLKRREIAGMPQQQVQEGGNSALATSSPIAP